MQMDFSVENVTRHYQDMEERAGLRSRYCSRDHTYYRNTSIQKQKLSFLIKIYLSSKKLLTFNRYVTCSAEGADMT